jgi:hypothetical protein
MRNSHHNSSGGTKPRKRLHSEKQLRDIDLAEAEERRRMGQALDRKRFARLLNVSYSKARRIFNSPDFPVRDGIVLWPEFIQWRNLKTGLAALSERLPQFTGGGNVTETARPNPSNLPVRAARILDESANGTDPAAPKAKAA